MKILCVIDSLGSGGAQRQLVNLAVGFKEKGHEVSFLVYHSINFFKDILDEKDIIVHECIESNYITRLLKIRRFIRNGNYDSVLSFLEVANFICEFAGIPRRKWKLIVGERSANPKILKSLKLRLYRWVHLLADHVIANSNANIEMIRRINPLLKEKKCHVIYNIVDFERWKPDPDYQFRKNGKLHIIVVASHQYLKNLNGLIEAVALLNEDERKQLHISWYGGIRNDDSKDKGIEKIERLKLRGIFHFYDPTLQIHSKVKEADALGLFSFYEGLPNSICEALAAGKIIISSRISDNSILIGEETFLFNPNSIIEIQRTLKHLLKISQYEFESISMNNVLRARYLFNNEAIIDKYLKLLGMA